MQSNNSMKPVKLSNYDSDIDMCSTVAEHSLQEEFDMMMLNRPIQDRTVSQNKNTKPSFLKLSLDNFESDSANSGELHDGRMEPAGILNNRGIEADFVIGSQTPQNRELNIMMAVQKSSSDTNLIGDFSRCFALPLIEGRHKDLKAIAPCTLAKFLVGNYGDTIESFRIIDCRYPYEFEGGHITEAVNLYTKGQCTALLKKSQFADSQTLKHHILIFYCDQSYERGPKLCRFLRQQDRLKNEAIYPSLNYPEMYILDGGYKSFFEQFPDLCTPKAYKPKLHPDHKEDLKLYKHKPKIWKYDSRRQYGKGKSIKILW